MSYKNILDMQTSIYGLLNDMSKVQSIQEDIIFRLDRLDYRLSGLENRLSKVEAYLVKK